MIRTSSLFTLLFLLPFLGFTQYAKYVNPIIGTDGTGHTFPGAVVPFGMVQLSPDTRNDGTWEGTSGYHYSDSTLLGFSHTHLSGTGVSDWGDVLIVPQTGPLRLNPEHYRLPFNHDDEIAEAGYYSVQLEDVKAELTATERVGFHRYSFKESDTKRLLIDLIHRDDVTKTSFKQLSPTKIVGFRKSSGWAKEQHVHFVMEFSKEVSIQVFHNGTMVGEGEQLKGKIFIDKHMQLAVNFKGDQLEIKTALSFTDRNGALLNLTEADSMDFNAAKGYAKEKWNKMLGRVEVESPQEKLKTVFYTALYHCMIHPSLASDIDGRYRGMDMKIHKDTLRPHYTVFSLWDTYRALHPLFNLLIPSKNDDFIHSMLDMYEQSGRLPVWELSANETDCMIGYHSVSVIADAFAKGNRSIDYNYALSAMVQSAETDLFGLPYYREKGFIGAGDEHESVSKTLEYAYDDWCISVVAEALGKEELKDEFKLRSKAWRHLFNKQTGFIQPRQNGGWIPEFQPSRVDLNYTEANGWQYNFAVPHDIKGLINAYGGKQLFEEKLDEFFNTTSKTSGLNHPDITGMIGQYAHGNEPSHHYAMLYNYTGSPEKTQEVIKTILNEFYTDEPDGLIGNDDCGQMSAWYVFNSIGFYPTLPGSPYYDITSPLFERATLHLENGNDLTIKAENAGSNYKYLIHHKNYVLDHHILMRGGTYEWTMGDEPIPQNKASLFYPDYSSVTASHFVPVPVLSPTKEVFKDTLTLQMKNNSVDGKVIYKLNEDEPQEFDGALTIDTTTAVQIWNKVNNKISPKIDAVFHVVPNKWKIKISTPYNPTYNAGGDVGLIDGLYGDQNWKKGRWQGYQNTDMVATIDLMERMKLDSIGVSFLQDTRSWILMPKDIVVETSRKKGKEFQEVARLQCTTDPKNYDIILEKVFTDQVRGKVRSVRITAKNYGPLPEWHQGYPYNGNSFFFVDEIMIIPED